MGSIDDKEAANAATTSPSEAEHVKGKICEAPQDDKHDLFVVCYSPKGPKDRAQKMHWALLLGPSAQCGPAEGPVPGTRYHAVRSEKTFGKWAFEAVEAADIRFSKSLRARILIAQVKDKDRLVEVMRQVMVPEEIGKWDCAAWISDFLNILREVDKSCEIVGRGSILNFEEIEADAREYVGKKIEEGRYEIPKDSAPRPTWDMMRNAETTP